MSSYERTLLDRYMTMRQRSFVFNSKSIILKCVLIFFSTFALCLSTLMNILFRFTAKAKKLSENKLNWFLINQSDGLFGSRCLVCDREREKRKNIKKQKLPF